jgi:hypothetical protein
MPICLVMGLLLVTLAVVPLLSPQNQVVSKKFPHGLVILVGAVSPHMQALGHIFWSALTAKASDGCPHVVCLL